MFKFEIHYFYEDKAVKQAFDNGGEKVWDSSDLFFRSLSFRAWGVLLAGNDTTRVIKFNEDNSEPTLDEGQWVKKRIRASKYYEDLGWSVLIVNRI